MFQKLINTLVDDLILGKSAPKIASKTQPNPLMYPRHEKGLKIYSRNLEKDIKKKTSIKTKIPERLSVLIGTLAVQARTSPFITAVLLTSAIGFIFFRPLFFTTSFIITGAASRKLSRYLPFITGFDLCLFFGILASIIYSPAIGFMTGVVSSLIGSYLREISRAEYYFTPLYGFIPIFVIVSLGIIPTSSLMLLSMICVISYILARMVMIQMIYNICIINQFTYITTTLFFNYILFKTIAPVLIQLMA